MSGTPKIVISRLGACMHMCVCVCVCVCMCVCVCVCVHLYVCVNPREHSVGHLFWLASEINTQLENSQYR